VWAVIFAVGYVLKGSTPGYPLLHVFGGFLLGMLSMYIAMRVFPSYRGEAGRFAANPRVHSAQRLTPSYILLSGREASLLAKRVILELEARS
jgi:hypothetical protein